MTHIGGDRSFDSLTDDIVSVGKLLKSRVVEDPRVPLAEALDLQLTGYAVFEPQETLLLEAEGKGVLTFDSGIPEFAYFTGTDRGGPTALADLAMPGPYHVRLVRLPDGPIAVPGETSSFVVPPGMPAERLAGDQALATSTRRAVSPDGDSLRSATDHERSSADASDEPISHRKGAVEAFLEDEEKIEAIRKQARKEAKVRAAEWGFDVNETEI